MRNLIFQCRLSEIGYGGMVGGLVLWGLCPAIAIAQLTPDNTLGSERSLVLPGTVQGAAADVIQGGARRGANLFHSFGEFNVSDRQRVYFADPTGVTNILARVTGNNASTILGTLGVNGTANLYLLNPNGILFGPNARLDIRGSLMVSTADSINFDNGFRFSASNPQAPPLLTINVPIGLQFGATVSDIRLNGAKQTDLRVGTGQTLALVGGNIYLSGGNIKGTEPLFCPVPLCPPRVSDGGGLTAPGGRIELGSVAAGSLVTITSTNPGWELGYGNVQQFQDIRLTQAARVEASGNGGGSIQVQGRRISVTDGSQIINPTLGSQPGKNLTIYATELVEVLGDPAFDRSSRLATETNPGASGNSGDLMIETPTLRVVDGGVISAKTLGAGNSGNLTVRARTIELVGVNPFARIPSSMVTQVNQRATGNAGNLTIETETLRVADGALISVGTFEVGNSGNLTVRAKSIEITGFNQPARFVSGLFAQTTIRAIGDAGDINLVTDRLTVTNRGEISATSPGTGRAGNISIQANSQIILTDGGQISANTNTGRGNIALSTPLLLLRRGSSIISTAAGTGTGGNITINAGFLVSAPNENNDIIANAFAGSGGRIAIAAQGIFGFDFRTREDLQRLLNTTNPLTLDPQRLPTNDITAFSQANPTIDTGTVILRSPDLDPTQGLTLLPTDVRDRSQLLAATCPTIRGSSFAVTGRGGVPEDPRQPLMGQVIWQDTRGTTAFKAGPDEAGQRAVAASRTVGKDDAIVEAQGWVVDQHGTVTLVASSSALPGVSHPPCYL